MRRAACLTLVGLWLLGQLGAAAHLAFVEHETCAHGELVHDDDGSDEAPSGEADHEHCSIIAHRTVDAVVAGGADLLVPVAPSDHESSRAPVVRVRSRAAILRFAPKTSPPA